MVTDACLPGVSLGQHGDHGHRSADSLLGLHLQPSAPFRTQAASAYSADAAKSCGSKIPVSESLT